MSDADALLGEINQILAGQTVSYTTASKPYDVYEGYIFALIVDTATQCNAQVYYQNVFGRTTDQLVFRTGPAPSMAPASPTRMLCCPSPALLILRRTSACERKVIPGYYTSATFSSCREQRLN